MKRTLVLVLFLTALLGISSVWAQTTWNYPGAYPTIQATINAASPGDIVQIAAGTYSESLGGWRDLELFKSLSLIGAGPGSTIIEFTNLQHGLEIRPDATGVVLIEGITFTKQAANEYAAGWPVLVGETGGVFNSLTFTDVEVAYASGRNIHLANSSTVYHNVIIEDCDIHHSAVWGFSTAGTINAITVTDSDFEYNGSYGSLADPAHGNGFDLSGGLTQNVTVTGGSFSYNTQTGINLMQVQNATFTGVTASYNTGAPGGGFGIKLDEWGSGSSGIEFIDCTTNYNALDGITITPEGPDAISDVLVSGCTSTANGRNGVGLWYINSGTNNPSMSDVTITMSSIYGNSGLEIEVGAWWVPMEISETFDATYNWFGDADPSDDVSPEVLYDPWWADAAMETLDSNNYLAGHSYTFTVHSPTSEDGAKAYIWGFYTNTSNSWANTTYGTGYFSGGYATVEYTVPLDYSRDFYWEVIAYQSPSSQVRCKLWNTAGPWDQFDTYLLDGQTIEMEAYRFDEFDVDLATASFKMVGLSGAIPDNVDAATVEVIVPWSGSINDYDNSVYNNTTLYNKKGLLPTYADNLGYGVQVVASNPSSPMFQEIRITKPSIGYDVTLFGFRIPTGDDPLGYMWWTTFYNEPVQEMDMVYDPVTGICSGSFSAPLEYDTQYFIQPVAEIFINADLKYYYTAGSMDLILSGGEITPIRNIDTGIYYDTIQAAIDDPLTLAGHVIEVAPGTYDEAVVINKGITLDATGTAAETIINVPAGTLTTGVKILGTNLGTVTVDGFTVQGWTENGIVQGMSYGTGTTVHVLNNIVISNGTYMRNGIQVSGDGSTVIGNEVWGAHLTDDWAGTGITVVNASNVLVEGNYVTGGDIGVSILDYSATSVSNVTVYNNELVDNGNGVRVDGRSADPGVIDDILIDSNIISGGKRAINSQYCGSLGDITIVNNDISGSTQLAIRLDSSSITVTGEIVIEDNDFADNYWHVSVPVGMEDLLPDVQANNTYDQSFIIENYIYGNAAALYVDVPDEVIPNDFGQTYSVKASYIEDLRGFTIMLKIPKADFVQPNHEVVPIDFALGEAYDGYALTTLMPILFDGTSDPDNYLYTITGAYGDAADGITGVDKELLTVTLTSVADPYTNVADGCYVVIDYDTVRLKDELNAPIACAGTVDGWVLIDSEDPEVEITNIEDYPDGMTLEVDGDGYVLPLLDLLYTDDYDLATAMYVIYPDGGTVPDDPTDFTDTVGTVDGETTTITDWVLPEPVGGYEDGTYVLYLLVTDEAGYPYILPWTFTIDTLAPTALEWLLCRTTPDADISVDLGWTYDADNAPAFINVWALDYALTPNAHAYPEYDPTDLDPTITNDIDPYAETSALGWVKVAEIPVASQITVNTSGVESTIDGVSLNIDEWENIARGYYYFTIYGEADNGQMSEPVEDPFYRESISYWPGDVPAVITGTVTSDDINVLSLAWGKTDDDSADWEATYRYCDVGPSTDFARRSRPMPDDLIDIEDLMMFAMNYENTEYVYYPRTFPEAEPVTIAMHAQTIGDRLTLSLELGGNTGFVKGLDIPIAYGSGLHFLGLETGAVWPEGSLLLHTDSEGVVTVSGATLGADPIVESNGVIATLSFAITGANPSFALEHMTARDHDNREIEIVNNPAGNVDGDDLINVIPEANYLGGNFPNPFHGTTTLQYGLKDAGSVKLSVYNTRGQLIRTLVNESKGAGTFQVNWNGRDANGRQVSAGVYFFRLETSEGVQTAKGLMIK